MFTQIPPFEALIRSALTDAGHEPVLEATEAGTGNAGGAPGASEEAGAPGASGALNEAGGPAEPESSGGFGGVGGSGGMGGSGGSAGADRSVTTAGTGDSPVDAGAMPRRSQASSAQNDLGCSIGHSGTAPPRPAPLGMLGGLLAALGLALRRRR